MRRGGALLKSALRMASNGVANGAGETPCDLSPSVYPLARRDEAVVESICGVDVKDPYRHLEDPDAEETKAFVEELNKISKPFLAAAPAREAMKTRLTAMWDYPKWGCVSKRNGRYFFAHNSGLQNQYVYYQSATPDGDGEVFLDQNKLSEDGTTALGFKAFSKDGTLFAYGIAEKGSDWNTLKIKKFPSGEELPDELHKLRYTSCTWLHDNSGIFYSMYPDSEAGESGASTEKNKHHSLHFHRLGDKQSEDVKVVSHEDPDMMIGGEVSEDGKLLLVTMDKGCDPKNLLYYTPILGGEHPKGPIKLEPIVDTFKAKFDYIDSVGKDLILQTNEDAPMFKLVKAKIGEDGTVSWSPLVPEAKAKLDWATPIPGNRLILSYLEDCKDVLYVHDSITGARLYKLPMELGSVTAFSAKKNEAEVFYSWESDLNPGATYRLDFAPEETHKEPPKATLIRQVKVPGLKADDFEEEQIFYPSKDGTKIPMFIIRKKGMAKDGSAPCILYGYGGFNIPLTPAFSLSRLLWAQHFEGVYAIANLRGGSEYGESWHEAGMKERKQNVFDDFIAAAEYLLREKWTSNDRLVSHGASNGGLLVAATANQRPDLFAGVINRVGVLDMLRFHKFTIGAAWMPEFGCPDKAEDFAHIFKYSPLHNIPKPIAPAQLPSQMIMTADHDDRVSPLHSLKFMAELYDVVKKNLPQQSRPLIARIETKAGHGAGKPTTKIIDELVDLYSYVQRVVNAKWTD